METENNTFKRQILILIDILFRLDRFCQEEKEKLEKKM